MHNWKRTHGCTNSISRRVLIFSTERACLANEGWPKNAEMEELFRMLAQQQQKGTQLVFEGTNGKSPYRLRQQ